MRFRRNILFFLIQLFFVQKNTAQNHEIRIVASGKSPPTTAQVTSAQTLTQLGNILNFAAPNAGSVCAVGMWALYDNTNFGQGRETSTTVITIRGYDPLSCASYTQFPGFRNVQSALFLGNPAYNSPGLTIFSQPNFLGSQFYTNMAPATTIPATPIGTLPNQTDSIALGSVAITGATGFWRLCADINCINAVCVDITKQRRNFYLNLDAQTDPSTTWPIIVRYIASAATADDCMSDINPPIFVGSSRVLTSSSTGMKALDVLRG